MNLPVGEVIEENLVLNQIDLTGLISALIDKQFTGYIVNTIEGFAGVEEGVLIFKKGEIVGSFYEYSNYDIIVFGDAAVQHAFNSLNALKGVFDIISLSIQQVDLVSAFNDRVKVAIKLKKSELLGLVRKGFTTFFAEKTLGNVIEQHESRQSILKRLGLSEIG